MAAAYLTAATSSSNQTTNPNDYVQNVLTGAQNVDITGMYYGTAYAQAIDQSVLPGQLQTAINTCTNDAACNIIAYDPITQFIAGYQDVGYILNTYGTTTDDALVLVKNTESVPSLVSPAGYTFTPWAVEDWSGNPSPPGASTNIMSGGPYFESQGACASRCDSTAGCVGFDFNAMNSGCYLYSGTGANVYSESYVGFLKNPPLTVGGTTPAGTDFTNSGSMCLQMSKCNTDMSSLVHNSEINGFSSREIASCSGCPVRSFQRTGLMVANELGVVTSYSSPDSAYTAIQYSVSTPVTHIDFTTTKSFTSYMYPSVKVSGLTVTRSTTLSSYTITGLSSSLGSSFMAFIVPYVTNGYIITQNGSGNYLQAQSSGTIGTYDISSSQIQPSMYSSDYNSCVFIVANS